MTTVYDQARSWRERNGFTREALGKLIGYAPETIFWAEKGLTPPGRGVPESQSIKPWVWLRYQRACEGLQRELDGKRFNWEAVA